MCISKQIFPQKMSRGSFIYNEVMIIAEILGYNVQYIKEKNISTLG